MALLSDRDSKDVRAQLASLTGPVTLVNFTQELACQYCRETEQLLKEVAALSDKIRLEIYNFQLDKAQVAQYRVDKIPATVVVGAKDYGIRAQRYQVRAVPRTVVNDNASIEGALPESEFVKAVVAAARKS